MGGVFLALFFSVQVQSQSWNLNGNAVPSGNEILGTINAQPLNLATNGQTRIVVKEDGNVGIGTDKTLGHRLSVEGKIRAREIIVNLDGWADFVFDSTYLLIPIDSVQHFVETQKHLPNIPKEDTLVNNGLALGAMNTLLMQKIEELHLYIFQLNERIKQLEAKKNEEVEPKNEVEPENE